MSKRIALSASSIQMPTCCAVCLEPSTGSYEIKRTLIDGLHKATITINVPLCPSDLKSANWKSPREILAERVGLVLGCAVSLLIGWFLFDRSTDSSGLVHWLVSPAICGAALFGSYRLVMRVIKPKFVHPKTKGVRNAVRIERYVQGAVELLIDNEKFAGRVSLANEKR